MDKWLKSPDSANIIVVVLKEDELVTIEEILPPRTVVTVLRRTPIGVSTKTANFLLVFK